MSAGAKYGLLLGLVVGVVMATAPGRVLAALWLVLAMQLAVAGVVTWRRTRLAFSTAAMLTGSGTLMLLAYWTFSGRPLLERSWPELLFFIALVAVGPAFFWLESHRSAEQWKAWREVMEKATLKDMLFLRHIPSLDQPERRPPNQAL